jgi:hypothetical protein
MLDRQLIDRTHIMQQFTQVDASAPEREGRLHRMYAQWMLLPQPAYITATHGPEANAGQAADVCAPVRANLERGSGAYCERTCMRCKHPAAVDNEPHALLEVCSSG